MFSRLFFATALMAALTVISVSAETHTITFTNRCGRGTPTLIQGSETLSSGGTYTHAGPIRNAIAYLQTGSCGFNGESCTTVETTLVNPTSPGSGSSSDITLIPPHTFSGPAGFWYHNGCEGAGANCDSANCTTAFHQPDDNSMQTVCLTDDVNLEITFC